MTARNAAINIAVAIALWVAVVWILKPWAGEYTTYAGEPFRIIHYGELDNVMIDTVQVLSITVRGETIEARIVGSNQPIYIKHPDRLEKIWQMK